MIENRKTYRLPFRAKIVFACGDKVYAGNSSNISAAGIFVTLLDSAQIPRESECRTVFGIASQNSPLVLNAVVKRVVARDPNPEVLPGIAFSFIDQQRDLARLEDFIQSSRQNFELAATILASGEPDLTSLQPLLQDMHLPPTSDLGELRFHIERILSSVELVDESNSLLPPRPPKP
ncbi:MAG: PilZ domain-containing protein [Bdellovibrionales bacterium]|nr:PilZ domain-containing protein [Bdellovibrionales bacterium]